VATAPWLKRTVTKVAPNTTLRQRAAVTARGLLQLLVLLTLHNEEQQLHHCYGQAHFLIRKYYASIILPHFYHYFIYDTRIKFGFSNNVTLSYK
jgi:hypothetical protein